MPRLKHLYLKEYPYLATTVTANREPIFKDSMTSDLLLKAIFFGRSQRWYYLLSFVIMPDHMHLIIIPRYKNISNSMKSIKGFSARCINKVFSRQGSIWQSGFYDYMLDSQKKILSRIKYIEDNPARKGLVNNPGDYNYSSARYREETDFGMFF